MNDEANNELKKYLEGQFKDVGKRFEAIDRRLEEASLRIEYVAKSVERLNGDVADLRGVVQAREEKLGELLAAMDGYVLRAEHTADEVAALTNRTDRLEKWVSAIGKHTGVTLNTVEP